MLELGRYLHRIEEEDPILLIDDPGHGKVGDGLNRLGKMSSTYPRDTDDMYIYMYLYRSCFCSLP